MSTPAASVQGCGPSLRFRHVKRLSVLGRDEASHGLSRVCSLTTVDMAVDIAVQVEGGSDLRVNSPVRCSAVQCSSVSSTGKGSKVQGAEEHAPRCGSSSEVEAPRTGQLWTRGRGCNVVMEMQKRRRKTSGSRAVSFSLTER